MSNSNFELIDTYGQGLIKAWTKGVPVEREAENQLRNVASMPFIHKHIAVMPDVHVGRGATIGSVIATKGAIIPAAVGVDLGCGMMAIRTSLTSWDLPENLSFVRAGLERSIPVGRTHNGGPNDKGAWDIIPNSVASSWRELDARYQIILDKHPKASARNTVKQLGTLGTGNHFIEICLDEEDHVWVMLHSGSRGVGNRIGMYFIERAKKEMERWHIHHHLPDRDLSYLVENTELFDDYLEAVEWAQDFALENRVLMMDRALKVLRENFKSFSLDNKAVNCHHNYVSKENHFGANVLVTRKGAVRAREGDLGIIPGSMGAKSFIVKGLGNKDSFNSCSHGAGRIMSRTAAKKTFTLKDHREATEGVECRKDKDVIDETPKAYKNIEDVMAAQSDLVDIVHTLKQVVCVKG